MVKGLEVFREHFRNFAIAMCSSAAPMRYCHDRRRPPFRATKDLDIVLFVEALDSAFVRAFWSLCAGGYEVQEKSTGEKQFYRFQKPRTRTILSCWNCSHVSRCIAGCRGSHLTPLPVEEMRPVFRRFF